MLDNDLQKASQEQPDLEPRKVLGRYFQRRMAAHVAKGTTDWDEAPMLNDPAAYTDPKWLEAEQREIFLKMPLLAGLTRDIPTPGDRMIFDAVGPSIVIVRTKDHSVKAFLNMCPHRATKIVTDCRKSNLMTCPFHGWTFDLDGKLVGHPGSESFEGLDKSKLGLITVPVVEWKGMIFVIARAGNDPIDIEAYLGPLADELAQYDFGHAKPMKKGRFDADTNWKFAVDTFGEGYHLATLHPQTVGKMAITNIIIYDEISRHHRVVFPLVQMLDYAHKPEEEWPANPYTAVYLLFPNTIVHIQPGGDGLTYFFYRIFPNTVPGKSFTLLSTYRSSEIPEDEDSKLWEEAHDFQVLIVGHEDFSVASTAQANLEHAPKDFRMVYGKNEIALQRFNRRIAEMIGRPILEKLG